MFRLCLVTIVVTVLALLAVGEQLGTIRAGYELDALRKEKERLLEERRQRELEVGKLATPEALQYRAAALKLDLSIPDRPRVVRVRVRPSDDRAWAEYDQRNSRMAGRGR